eukprot:1872917-Prymnesium_polylepis.1
MTADVLAETRAELQAQRREAERVAAETFDERVEQAAHTGIEQLRERFEQVRGGSECSSGGGRASSTHERGGDESMDSLGGVAGGEGAATCPLPSGRGRRGRSSSVMGCARTHRCRRSSPRC